MTGTARHWLGLGGKVCVITGGGGGLGVGLATSFAEAGARPVLLDIDPALLEQAAGEVRRMTGVQIDTVVCDVSDPAAVAEAARASEMRAGPCDILVNNAALLRPAPLDRLTFDDWSRLLAVNLTGYFLCAQQFGAQMRKAGGAMVHIASIAGSHPRAAGGGYSVAKAGIIMLSRQIAAEWGPHGIRSNVVSPGMVETPMSASTYAEPGMRRAREDIVPLRSIGQPQDIADAAMFLASPRARYISGDEIIVDGAFTRTIMSFMPRPGSTTG